MSGADASALAAGMQNSRHRPFISPGLPATRKRAAITTSGSTILTIGDFNQFLIADRVGMQVELVSHS